MIDDREKYLNNINGVQYILLNILKSFINICEKNDITYWLDSGTLLGAIRHKGFIPWDDDIDVCVPRNEIKKLKKILRKELPKHLFLQDSTTDKGINNQIIRIRDRYSRTENKVTEYHNGISIDIFPMDEIEENVITKRFKYLFLFGKTTGDFSTQKGLKRLILECRKKIGFNRKSIFSFFSKNPKKNNAYIYFEGECWGHIFLKEKIYPLKKIKFEDIIASVPNDCEYYLEKLYGKNYMKLPREEKRKIHHTLENISLIKSCIHKESLEWKKI